MQPNENGRLTKVAEGKEPESPWTVLVRRNRYVHESAQSGEFSKITYVPRDPDGNVAIGFAVIMYSAAINLQEAKPLAHKLEFVWSWMEQSAPSFAIFKIDLLCQKSADHDV